MLNRFSKMKEAIDLQLMLGIKLFDHGALSEQICLIQITI